MNTKTQLQLPASVVTIEDFKRVAQRFGCEPEVIQAIAFVETGWRPGKSGFQIQPEHTDKNGVLVKEHIAPIILFEMHQFGARTGYKYNVTHPHLSTRGWDRTKYGASNRQHQKMNEAAQLNRVAALESCSWGVFQVMGFNWNTCGYKDLQTMINAVYTSDALQLDAFCRFIDGSGLKSALQTKNWARIALKYNGSGYKTNAYDTKMAAAYKRFKNENAK